MLLLRGICDYFVLTRMSRLSQSWRENKLALTLTAQTRVVSGLGTWLLYLSLGSVFWIFGLFFLFVCFGGLGGWSSVSDVLAGYFTCWLRCIPLLLSSGHGSSWPMSIPAKPLEVAFYCHWWTLIKDGKRGLSLSQATLGHLGTEVAQVCSHTGSFQLFSLCFKTPSCNS